MSTHCFCFHGASKLCLELRPRYSFLIGTKVTRLARLSRQSVNASNGRHQLIRRLYVDEHGMQPSEFQISPRWILGRAGPVGMPVCPSDMRPWRGTCATDTGPVPRFVVKCPSQCRTNAPAHLPYIRPSRREDPRTFSSIGQLRLYWTL
jgi:hypothetical protein